MNHPKKDVDFEDKLRMRYGTHDIKSPLHNNHLYMHPTCLWQPHDGNYSNENHRTDSLKPLHKYHHRNNHNHHTKLKFYAFQSHS